MEEKTHYPTFADVKRALFAETSDVEQVEKPKFKFINATQIPISMDEYIGLRQKGGISITVEQSDMDFRENVIKVHIDVLL